MKQSIAPRIVRSLAACLLVPACATSSRAPAVPATAPAPVTASASTGAEIVARTNEARRQLGLQPLGASAALMRAAQLQADQMAAAGTMAHDLPAARYPTLASRLAAASYSARAAGENIAEGFSTPAAMVSGWMASPGHRANITSRSFTEMGAAAARSAKGDVYAVEVFAAPS